MYEESRQVKLGKNDLAIEVRNRHSEIAQVNMKSTVFVRFLSKTRLLHPDLFT